jgi:homoserine O-acetyltransferase
MAELDFAGQVLSEGGTWRFPAQSPLLLDSGGKLENLEIAYRTWGTLNEDGTNAVLVCHALTGDQHVASNRTPITGKPGWWTR